MCRRSQRALGLGPTMVLAKAPDSGWALSLHENLSSCLWLNRSQAEEMAGVAQNSEPGLTGGLEQQALSHLEVTLGLGASDLKLT